MDHNKQLNKKNISFIVLVGGLGSRIRHLYPNKPKPLISIHNKPFLYWLIKEIKDLNFKNVIYASGYKSEQIENWVNNPENLNKYQMGFVHHYNNIGKRTFGDASWTVVEANCHFLY